jgi:O6-methylguanine-DNA--protein-cysteine methyltransferase
MAREKRSTLFISHIDRGVLSIFLASSERGAVRIGLHLDKSVEEPEFFRDLFPRFELIRSEEMNRPLRDAVKAALDGIPWRRDISKDIEATLFQWKVWNAIADIPYGKTKTYGEVAKMVGNPGGARAVGQAMGRNPLPLLFP